ncbi:hypothetical protein JCM10213v2_006469 [Rhodosporidiobolus nylandii]
MSLTAALHPPGLDTVHAAPPARSLDWVDLAVFCACWLWSAYEAYANLKDADRATRRAYMKVACGIAVSVTAAVSFSSRLAALPATVGRRICAVDWLWVGMKVLLPALVAVVSASVAVVACSLSFEPFGASHPFGSSGPPNLSGPFDPSASFDLSDFFDPSDFFDSSDFCTCSFGLSSFRIRANERHDEQAKKTAVAPAGAAWNQWGVLTLAGQHELGVLFKLGREAVQATRSHFAALHKEQKDSTSRSAQARSQVLVHLHTEPKQGQVTETVAEETVSSSSFPPTPSAAVCLLDSLKAFVEQDGVVQPSDLGHAAGTIKCVWPLHFTHRARIKQERMLHRAILDSVLEWNAERAAQPLSGL